MSGRLYDLAPLARFGDLVATDLRDVTSDPAALDSTGFWAVVADFEGRLICAHFGDVRRARARRRARHVARAGPGRLDVLPTGPPTPPGSGPAAEPHNRCCREHIAAGEVYQANPCRVLSAPLPDPERADVDALTALLALGNPALRIIALETVPRGPYCGGVGWVDADRGTGQLAVAIRTFWIDRTAPGGPLLHFGTGAGITWGSDPERDGPRPG